MLFSEGNKDLVNYKLLFPTYRTRFLFVQEVLAEFQATGQSAGRLLHIGTGEGDYDRTFSTHADSVVACDVNESDLAFARELNHDLENLDYQIQDAQALTFESETFQSVVAIDVIEHVEDSEAMLREISRVLKPGGMAVVSFPSLYFPITYDPINRLLRLIGKRLPIGAYGFGHFKLIDPSEFEGWLREYSLQIGRKKRLTGYLTSLFEMYWPGVLQSLLKANSRNETAGRSRRFKLRPSNSEPPLVFLTDLLIELDKFSFRLSPSSVGIGYLLKKPLRELGGGS